MCDCYGHKCYFCDSELPELTAAGPKFESGKKLSIVKKENLGWLTKEEADEILHRCNCHKDLLEACKKALKIISTEGYIITEETIKQFEAAIIKAQPSKQSVGKE